MVELIPKETPRLPNWLNTLFYVSLALLLLSITGYFILDNSIKASQKNLDSLRETLVKNKTAEKVALEREIIKYDRKIDNLSLLLSQHLAPSGIFELLQDSCLPQVHYSQFNLDAKQASLLLSGITQSFETLGQQFLVLQGSDWVNDVKLDRISISKEGKVTFDLSLSLNPNVLR
ncbi:MAG: hypothetical protein PHE52_01450 [Candidatus Pacebacteria bacterium]|nr:hypothetical protein [Candidatus Paceibacterota bacterium]